MTADEIARAIVDGAVAPACAAGCQVRREGWFREVGGATELLFDLASVTKSMTATAIALAGIDPRTPLGLLLPEARATASEHVPLDLLLSHRAGLEANRPFFAPLAHGHPINHAATLRQVADARRRDLAGDPSEDGFPPLYSDLGYVLAGEALARSVGARDAGDAIARLVLEPLGIASDAGTVRDLAARGVLGPFAPTETVAWRGGQVMGAVHDENAWALTGTGGSGHAGIFARIGAVLVFGAAVLDALDGRAGPFAAANLRSLVHPRAGGSLRAGFDGKSPEGSSAGLRMGTRSFGHLGFTGTSLWIDPDAKVVVALLANRVCPTRASSAIKSARPWAHDALFARALALPASERYRTNQHE